MKKYHHLEAGDKDILSSLYIVNEKHTDHKSNQSTVKSITKNKKVQITILDDSSSSSIDTTDSPITVTTESTLKDQTKNASSINKENPICSICSKQFSIYSCPRCLIVYCSSDCFKQHNERCTGVFYEDQFQESLKMMEKVAPKDALSLLQKMKDIYNREDEILDRLIKESDKKNDDNEEEEEEEDEEEEEEDSDDNEDDANSSDNNKENDGVKEDKDIKGENESSKDVDRDSIDLSKLNLDEMSEDQLLSLLTKEEIEEFHQSIKDGSISDRLETWSPWWIESSDNQQQQQQQQQKSKPKIIEITEDVNKQQSQQPNLPEQPSSNQLYPSITNNIPPLSTIFPNKPSDCLFYHLLDIIYSYCFIMRRFNGEWGSLSYRFLDQQQQQLIKDENSISNLSDECSVLIELSTILKRTESKRVFTSLESVLESVLESTHKLKTIGGGNDIYFSLFTLEDLSIILSNKSWILSSLSHMHRHFTTLNRSMPANTDQLFKLTINFATHKLWFFMAWCNEQSDQSLKSLSKNVKDYFILKRKNINNITSK